MTTAEQILMMKNFYEAGRWADHLCIDCIQESYASFKYIFEDGSTIIFDNQCYSRIVEEKDLLRLNREEKPFKKWSTWQNGADNLF